MDKYVCVICGGMSSTKPSHPHFIEKCEIERGGNTYVAHVCDGCYHAVEDAESQEKIHAWLYGEKWFNPVRAMEFAIARKALCKK